MDATISETTCFSAHRINAMAAQLDARRYLEIGVWEGVTFHQVKIAERTGVDPDFAFDPKDVATESSRFVSQTSDAFFATEPFTSFYDLVFIDGLHSFTQVVRDFSNVIMHTHRRSVVIVDDTLPNDVYSVLPDAASAKRYRKALGNDDGSWHGDVFKIVFYLHDFWPSLNYRTIVGRGNPQTIVWRSNGFPRKPVFNSFEAISRLSYFDLRENIGVLKEASEEDAIALCIAEIQGS